MWSIKIIIIILHLEINPNVTVPNYSPLAPGQARTEIIEDIWLELDNQIRGPYLPPAPLPVVRPPLNDILDTEGEAFNAGNTECTLKPGFPHMFETVWQNVPNNGHEINFKKDTFPGNLGRDPTDASPVTAIFASPFSAWDIVNNLTQGGDFDTYLGTRYYGIFGVALCRRQQIQFLKVFNGYYCDIDTWLIYLCMRDEGVQQHTLRDPEDYDRYLGGRSESHAFKRMAREDCIRRIGAIPKDSRVTEFRLGSNFAVVYVQRMYVIASRLANYDFILKRKRRRPRQRQSIANRPIDDCTDMSLLRNHNRLYRRALEKGGEMMLEYDFHWLFCDHDAGAPLRIRPDNRKILKHGSINGHRNLTDVNMRGNEL